MASGSRTARAELRLDEGGITIVYPSGRWQSVSLHRMHVHAQRSLLNGYVVHHLAIRSGDEQVHVASPPGRGARVVDDPLLPTIPAEAAVIEEATWHALLCWLRHRKQLLSHLDTSTLIPLTCIATPEFATRIGRVIGRRIVESCVPGHDGPMRTSGQPDSATSALERKAAHCHGAAIALSAARREIEISKPHSMFRPGDPSTE